LREFVPEVEKWKREFEHLNNDDTDHRVENLVFAHRECNNKKKKDIDWQLLAQKKLKDNEKNGHVDGWILNHSGDAMFFTKNAVNGPGRPALQNIPNKLVSQTPPNKRSRASPPSRPPKINSWKNTNDLSKILLRN
jgi:hypothetical protein